DFKDASVDAVMSTVALHHLPDAAALERTISEVARVLRPGGGLYLVDFGHLKAEKSIEDFAYQYDDRQAELFTLDYLYSLRAAFTRDEFRRCAQQHLAGRARFYSTFIMPFMVAIKSLPREGALPASTLRELQHLRQQLPGHHQNDLADLRTFFRLGGLSLPLPG
ncbi:MAG: methyltransferase domain-containing protein, partial [Halioglobus sp.]|nr:methyltransferase domain-containing protein [Halioglobus sp.]